MNNIDRIREERTVYPSAMYIDSQSVKLSPMIGMYRGIDANKKANGRKRQLMTDMGGRLWHVHVHAAAISDGYGGLGLSEEIFERKKRLKKVFGDQAYKGVFAKRIESMGLTYQKASKPESAKGFVPVKGRWVVERTIAWTSFFRRLTKDYERTTSSSEEFLLLANIQLMLQRIAT
jgi:transposase